jgi:dUTPase
VVVAIPFGYSGYVKPRGSTIRHPNRPCGLRILNDGVPIDPGFRKEIWAELYNCGPESYILYKDVRLVQLVIEKVSVARPLRVERIEDLPTSVRGGNSNGSSGC